MAALSHDERIAALTLAEVYPHYVTKAEKKGHSERALLEVITWLTGLSKAEIDRHLDAESTFEDVFAEAELNPNASDHRRDLWESRRGDREPTDATGSVSRQAR